MVYLNGEFLPIEQAAGHEQGGTPPCISPTPVRPRYSEEIAR
jgi:hypothetical protein